MYLIYLNTCTVKCLLSKEGRKRRVLTLEKKLEVIHELKDGKSQRLVHILRYGHFLVMGTPWTHAARIIDIISTVLIIFDY